MRTLIVTGVFSTCLSSLSQKDFDYIVGVDRGNVYLLEQGWPIDLAVGDFDSATEIEVNQIKQQAKEMLVAQAEKDDTDTQLALERVFKKFPETQVFIIGATGGRVDHFLANLWMPLETRFKPYAEQIKIQDNQNSISYYLPGNHTVYKEADKNYLAYCCLTPVKELTLSESKYTLKNQEVEIPTSYASNEFINEKASFSFASGMVAVIQSKD
ncbi:thiamine diphosphokinase [Melissococcus plutonius]|uniref:Thiamine diphosphokinase n=2 Tax=Melissococcus plutonius TaxID=33970 RepID=F3Y8C2_MELPT|nr:thiamine diphosphokinase [Melissococcus plutonius]BAL61537.1 thiamin pyrophosphokinase [Melissococcus plutonius DAT561]AIM24467.1 thiamine pyrophosphokinase ThiN [Melissococcus plutonius S1]KMT25879.1 thiamine pyrophosphokinase ThiN [Melissococcus plutonius]KMT27224.1 thiamine pyrophosphokinase ThiN [Melissococcus plutonius]KMT28325.1 thiamine pyrophosphokinase ThiN [Melissococcus plutonius]